MSKQLSAEWEEKIEQEAEAYAERTGDRLYNIKEYYTHNDRKAGYEEAAEKYVLELVEAQERIKNIEKGIGDLIADMESWKQACIDEMKRVEFNEDRSIGYDLNGRSKAEFDGILPRLKAISPVNPQKKEDE